MRSVFEKFCIRAPFHSVRDFFRSLKYAYQRATKGYCDRDKFFICDWFAEIMPEMLKEFKEDSWDYPSYISGEPEGISDEERKVLWQKTLDEMIFLFLEANGETCSVKNPYDEKWSKCCEDFEKKYGHFGEGLCTAEEKKRHVMHTPSELPENEELSKKHSEELVKIEKYKEECMQKALALFAKHYNNLWG